MHNLTENKSILQFSNLEFMARQVVEGFITGLHKSPLHGFSVEFAEHRLYNKGESTRHIDWKLFARTDRLYTKIYEEETNLRCQLVIDNSSSMHYPILSSQSKIAFSAMASASLIYLLKKQRDAVGLTVFSDKTEVHTPAKSTNVHHKLLFNELEKVLADNNQNKKTLAIKALHNIAESIHKRSLVIIFSDMMENTDNFNELFSALHHLKHNKHEIILFHVTDKKTELDFDFENRPYTFIDVETGEEVKAQASDVKEAYLKSIKQFHKELKLKCAQFHVDYVEADINKGFDTILLAYLVKRGKLL
jgi:uncharacterized protein (DUF58 family)